MAFPFTDNFNRVDANPIGGSWTTFAPLGDLKIVSNQCVAAVPGACAYYNVETPAADCEITGTYRNPSTLSAYLLLRFDIVNFNLYYLVFSATGWNFAVVTNSFDTELGVFQSRTNMDGDVFTFRIVGNVLSCFINGVLQSYTQTDNTYPDAGYAGIYFDNTVSGFDDVTISNVPSLVTASKNVNTISGATRLSGKVSEIIKNLVIPFDSHVFFGSTFFTGNVTMDINISAVHGHENINGNITSVIQQYIGIIHNAAISETALNLVNLNNILTTFQTLTESQSVSTNQVNNIITPSLLTDTITSSESFIGVGQNVVYTANTNITSDNNNNNTFLGNTNLLEITNTASSATNVFVGLSSVLETAIGTGDITTNSSAQPSAITETSLTGETDSKVVAFNGILSDTNTTQDVENIILLSNQVINESELTATTQSNTSVDYGLFLDTNITSELSNIIFVANTLLQENCLLSELISNNYATLSSLTDTNTSNTSSNISLVNLNNLSEIITTNDNINITTTFNTIVLDLLISAITQTNNLIANSTSFELNGINDNISNSNLSLNLLNDSSAINEYETNYNNVKCDISNNQNLNDFLTSNLYIISFNNENVLTSDINVNITIITSDNIENVNISEFIDNINISEQLINDSNNVTDNILYSLLLNGTISDNCFVVDYLNCVIPVVYIVTRIGVFNVTSNFPAVDTDIIQLTINSKSFSIPLNNINIDNNKTAIRFKTSNGIYYIPRS